MIGNFFKYIHLVNKHRFMVFLLCTKSGFPLLGLTHDLSMYSLTELKEGVKYYKSKKTFPFNNALKTCGYSNAWLHHRGRNKHHSEYWFDYASPLKAPVIPFKYAVELLCDKISYAKMLDEKKYSDMSPYYKWNKNRDNEMLNRHIQGFITEVLELLGAHGEKVVLRKKYLEKIYIKHINKKKGED